MHLLICALLSHKTLSLCDPLALICVVDSLVNFSFPFSSVSPFLFSVTAAVISLESLPRVPPPRHLISEEAVKGPTSLSKPSWLKEGKAVLLSAYANMAHVFSPAGLVH